MNKHRGCQSDFTVTDEELDIFPELRFEITDFTPGRPAPACSNPSSPAYSDPGDPMEFDVAKIILTVNNVEIEVTGETREAILEAVDCRLENKVENIGCMAIEEAWLDAHIASFDKHTMRKGA